MSLLDDPDIADRPSALLADVLGAKGAVRTVFQPIVDLISQHTVGYEALTRGPADTPLEAPMRLFGEMDSAGRLSDFDEACRDAALARAIQGGISPPLTVFVNVEPSLLTAAPFGEDDSTWVRAPNDLRCVIELTERALLAEPAELLAAVALIRDLNWGVALDDVGADPTSLALMSLLRPDVIKLDLRLVQQRTDRDIAEIVTAVNAQAEETDAAVLAEGIETQAHLETALALGATLGQGYFFGHPEPLPEDIHGSGPPVRFLGSGMRPGGPTPFEHVIASQPTRRGEEHLVAAMQEHLLTMAAGCGPATLVLATTGPGSAGHAQISALADHVAMVAIVGPEPDNTHPEGVITALDDSLGGEWDTVILAPHFAAALVTRRAGGPEGGDAFDFAVTHRRDLVAICARSLAARIKPLQS